MILLLNLEVPILGALSSFCSLKDFPGALDDADVIALARGDAVLAGAGTGGALPRVLRLRIEEF